MPLIEFDDAGRRIYEPAGRVLAEYLVDRRHVSVIRGPIGCLSGNSEFLTPDGWKRIDSFVDGDLVAEWDSETGDISFSSPLAYIAAPCAEMWRFSNKNTLSMELSDEHRIALYDRNGNFKVRRADDVAREPGRYRLPVNFRPTWEGLSLSEHEIRLAVAINADGHFPSRGNQIVICVRKDRKKARIRELLSACGIEWDEQCHGSRETEIKFVFSRGDWKKGFGPEWYRASVRQLGIVLEECLFWDGLHAHEEHRFYSSKKADADFIQYAAHATGRRASIGVIDHAPEKGWNKNYTVFISLPGSAKGSVCIRSGIDIERIEAPGGMKYCFTTRTGFFVARNNDRVFVTGNSGTSSASCYKIAMIAAEQRKSIDGIRRNRWAVIRNSYPELRNTTVKTWLDWFPENLYGRFNWAKPMTHVMRWADVELEVIFLALDDEGDIRKLRSLELTGVWFNELEYIPKPIFDEAESRTGRFPSVKEGGASWSGVIGDMNAPNEDHWLTMMTREVPYPDEVPEDDREFWPEEWGYHVQPPALIEVFGPDGKTVVDYVTNPVAENVSWLEPDFYHKKRKGKSKQWIDSRLMNRITFVTDGDPVWPMFRRETHVSPAPLAYNPGYPLTVALDFGRRPTALMGQEIGNRLYILSEFRMYGVGATTFAPALKRFLDQNYPGAICQFTGDPKGQDKGQADEVTAYQVFGSHGMTVKPAPVKNNHIETRLMAVEQILNDMWMGAPRLVIDPVRCPTLVAAMSGKYCLEMTDGEPRPVKRGPFAKYSDIADCAQYMVLFLGNGNVLSGGHVQSGPRVMNVRHKFKSLRRVEA